MIKWWRYGVSKDMIALEDRIDLLDMVYHVARNIDDEMAIKGAIIGLHSYYQKKYQTVKEEDDRMRAKMIEDYEKEKPIIMPEGEQ